MSERTQPQTQAHSGIASHLSNSGIRVNQQVSLNVVSLFYIIFTNRKSTEYSHGYHSTDATMSLIFS